MRGPRRRHSRRSSWFPWRKMGRRCCAIGCECDGESCCAGEAPSRGAARSTSGVARSKMRAFRASGGQSGPVLESGQGRAMLVLFVLLEGFRHFAETVVDEGKDAIPGELAAGVARAGFDSGENLDALFDMRNRMDMEHSARDRGDHVFAQH